MEESKLDTDKSKESNDIISSKNIESYIEKQIETKMNSLLETLPEKLPDNELKKNAYNLTIKELYKNTLQCIIDIIDDVTKLNNIKNIDTYIYINRLINIVTYKDRKLYVGIIMIILSFALYF